jgi:hypothetical protein
MQNTAHLLFSNHNFGHGFDEASYLKLIELLANQTLVFGPDITTVQLGYSADESTTHSKVPYLYGVYKFIYVLTTKQHSTLLDLRQALAPVGSDTTQVKPVESVLPPISGTELAVQIAVEQTGPPIVLHRSEEPDSIIEEVVPKLDISWEFQTVDQLTEAQRVLVSADVLRYRSGTGVITEQQRDTIFGGITGATQKWLDKAINQLDSLEHKSVAELRVDVIKHNAAVCQTLWGHIKGLPDNWRVTLIPRMEGARIRTDDAALDFLHKLAFLLLSHHHMNSPQGPTSLYIKSINNGGA